MILQFNLPLWSNLDFEDLGLDIFPFTLFPSFLFCGIMSQFVGFDGVILVPRNLGLLE